MSRSDRRARTAPRRSVTHPPLGAPVMVLLSSVDPVLRGSASFAAVTDVPGTAVLTLDLDLSRNRPLHRHLADGSGVRLDEWVAVDPACVTCAVRDGTLPLLERLVREGRHATILVAAPVGMASLPLARALDEAAAPAGRLAPARLASVAVACDAAGLPHDLLGDDLLVERGLALDDEDIRSVGEVLAHQVAHADFVLTSDPVTDAPAPAGALLDHVRGADSHLVDDFLAGHLGVLFDHSHACEHASRRVDPLHVGHNGAPERDGVWSLHLTSGRPVHPERFLDRLPDLAGDKVRSRGHFWLPTRPLQACAWDGAGAQLSLGSLGEWGDRRPATSLVFTGIAEERAALIEAFDSVLLTPEEDASGPVAWLGRDDGLDPWLGGRGPAAD